MEVRVVLDRYRHFWSATTGVFPSSWVNNLHRGPCLVPILGFEEVVYQPVLPFDLEPSTRNLNLNLVLYDPDTANYLLPFECKTSHLFL